jgi:hypothetical protein
MAIRKKELEYPVKPDNDKHRTKFAMNNLAAKFITIRF